MNTVSWFEIGTDEPARAERFYGEVFGWTFADDEDAAMPYRLVTTPAADKPSGGVFDTGGRTPNYATFVVTVQDVEKTCAVATAAGGSVLVPPQRGDGGLVFAHLRDPSGNHFGVFSPPTA